MTPGIKLEAALAQLPKAELHLHLEGSVSPATLSALADKHGQKLSTEEAAARYEYSDFNGFLDLFKWVSSFLRTPDDYALILQRLAEDLHRQNVVYAEVTISVGVMLRRQQDVESNFAALCQAANVWREKGLRLRWVFDATRQFGAAAALEVAHQASRFQSAGVVAFGMGGDELVFPASDFRATFDFARAAGLHLLVHAGEVGGPEAVRDALDLLHAERIGHGIAVMRDPALAEHLAAKQIPLENCLTSNLRTGALALQTCNCKARLGDHPLPKFLETGLKVALSTDDPALFDTDLLTEYSKAASLGLSPAQLGQLVETSFQTAFLPPNEKSGLLEAFRTKRTSLGLV